MTAPRRRALLLLVGLTMLLAAVAIASTGSVPTGAGGTRRPSERFVDVVVSLILVAMALGALVWAYLLLIRKDILAEAAAKRRRRSPWATAIGFAIMFGLLAVFVRWLSVDVSLRQRFQGRAGTIARPPPGGTTADGTTSYEPHFATIPVVVTLVVVAAGVLAAGLAYRTRRRHLPGLEEPLGLVLADVLDESIDDLRRETDPRRAVIAAYARMERALAAYGLPRADSEAPEEYLSRILTDLEVSTRAVSRLTALFEQAKFSQHEVGHEMKDEAIGALARVREELRAAEVLAEHERLAALEEMRAQAAR